jgi:hypothetical protein
MLLLLLERLAQETCSSSSSSSGKQVAACMLALVLGPLPATGSSSHLFVCSQQMHNHLPSTPPPSAAAVRAVGTGVCRHRTLQTEPQPLLLALLYKT